MQFVTAALTRYCNLLFYEFPEKEMTMKFFTGNHTMSGLRVRESVLEEILRLKNLLVARCDVSTLKMKASLTNLSGEPIRIWIDRIELDLTDPLDLMQLADRPKCLKMFLEEKK
jgi:VPS13-like, N-terminal